jgi:serine/threonine-protein kinase
LEDSALVAARIKATGIAVPILAALDDWAYDWSYDWASLDPGRHEWLLEVAQQVDENPASLAIRTARLWDNKAALKEFAQSAPLSNQSVPFLKFLGVKLNLQGGDSIAYFRRVQQAHLNSYTANNVLALTLLMGGNPAESLRYFQAAIALRPTQASCRCNFGKALGDLGKLDEALVEFEEARRLSPDMALFTTNIGIVLNNMNRPADAERELRKVLDVNPTDAPCLTALANSMFRQGRHSEAIEAYRRAIAADPTYVEAYRHLKECCLRLRRWEDGRIAWQQWLACDDRNS